MKAYVINNIAKLRKEKRITQEELAENVQVSRQTVIAIEKGNYIPSLLLGLKMAKFFNKRVEEVFSYHEK
jgi:putative transcriptional regulator